MVLLIIKLPKDTLVIQNLVMYGFTLNFFLQALFSHLILLSDIKLE